MLKPSALKPRRQNKGRPPEKSAQGFLQWVRGRDCLACHGHCEGKIEAAHVDYAGDKGMGSKVSDCFTVPLCSKHHRLQHSMGWGAFEREYWGREGYALAAAADYWSAWPGRVAWERKLNEVGE